MPAGMFGAAAEYIGSRYGGTVAELVGVESVGTTQSEVLRADPERVFVLLVNLSTNTMYVGIDSQVSSSRGILLASNGGSFQVDVEEDFTVPIRSFHAISTGASSNLYVLSVRRIARNYPVET